MPKELTVSEWIEEINAGLKFRQKYGLEEQWGELEALLYNVHPSSANSGPNILLSTLDGLASSLTVPFPYITIKARQSSYLDKSRVVESVDNMLIDMLQMPVEVERATCAAYLWGQGIAKIGYDSEYGWDEKLDIGLQNPVGATLSSRDKNMDLIEYNRFRPGMPWLKFCLPHDIVVPWGVFDFDETPWIAHRVVRHIESVRADTKYTGTRSIKPNMSMEDFVKSYQTSIKPYRLGTIEYNGTQSDGDQEYVELWEIHDRRKGEIKVLCVGHDKWLRKEPNALQINGMLPFVSMSFVPRVRNFWTTPDASYLRWHQAELSDIAIQASKHRRLQVLKLLYDEDAITEAELERALSSQVGLGIKIKGGHDIEKVFKPFTPGSPNQSLYMDANMIRTNAREQVGFSKNQVGEFEPTGRRTATEVSEVAEASSLRLDRRQNALKRFYISSFQVINNIICQNWKQKRTVEVIGSDGTSKWFAVSGDDLKGDYLYKAGFSTGGNETLQQRQQMAMQTFMMLSQDPRFDPIALAQYLSRAFNDPELTSVFAKGVLNGTATLPSAGGQGGQGGPTQLPMGGAAGGGQGVSAFGGSGNPQGANFNPG